MSSNHILFPSIEVKQGRGTCLYLGALKFKTLADLYTVSPREARTDDPYYDDSPAPYPQFSQRPERKERLREISEFVAARLTPSGETRKEIIFPGTVILGLLTDVEIHQAMPINPTPTAAHIIRDESDERGRVTILLSCKKASLFIIDGQHRIKGLAELHERLSAQVASLSPSRDLLEGLALENLERLEVQLKQVSEFEIPISLLVDFDLEEQAMVFATVNFKQKPVQRSFYYDIFGAFESEKITPISFSHELAIHLNNSEKSPLRGMIKLLGTGPGLISQAFLVARLEPLLDPQDRKSVFRSYFQRRHQGDKQASQQFASIVRNFFSAVREDFFYAWPTPNEQGKYSAYNYDFILLKSMVVSGLLAILREIYKLCVLDFAAGKEGEVVNSNIFDSAFFREFFTHIDVAGRIQPQQSEFSKTSRWAVGGSAKIERIIFEELRKNVLASYSEISQRTDSKYQIACNRFGGERAALRILGTLEPETRRTFWGQTETDWERSNPPAKTVAVDFL